MVSNIREVSDFELMLQKQVEAVFKKRVLCISIKILWELFSSSCLGYYHKVGEDS